MERDISLKGEIGALVDVVLARPDSHFQIVGIGGSGKSSLLLLLEKALREEGHAVAHINTWIASSADLISTIAEECAAELGNAKGLIDFEHQVRARRSSRSRVLHYLVDLVESSLKPGQLIFIAFDELDREHDATETLTVIAAIITLNRPHIRVLVASRPSLNLEALMSQGRERAFTILRLDAVAGRSARRSLMRSEAVLEVATGDSLPQSLADAKVLLEVISAYVSVSVDTLSRVTGLGRDYVINFVRNHSSLGFFDAERLGFLHESLRDGVVRGMLPSDFHPGLLRFGDEAAERDSLLDFDSGYMVRPDFDLILSGIKTIVLGDRGAGKSATFRKLDSVSVNPRDGCLVIVGTASDPASFLQQMSADGQGSSADRFKAIWLLYCAALAAKYLHPLVDVNANHKYLRSCYAILRNVGWAAAIRNEGLWSQMWAWMRSYAPTSVKFTVGAVTIAPSWSEAGSKSVHGRVSVTDFLKETDRILTSMQKSLLIVFDQIDEPYKYERTVQEALIQGLFLGEALLSQTRAIRTLVLLRTDLFEIYDIQEKNKFVSRMIRLDWTKSELLALMRARLCGNDALVGVCALSDTIDARTGLGAEVVLRSAFPEEVEGQPFVQWLTEGLQTGNHRISPRQIILFLNLARDSLEKDARRAAVPVTLPIFSRKNASDAMTAISELSYQEVISDFRVAPGFVRSCRAARLTEFDFEDVQSLFEANDGDVLLQIERLERLGFIERLVDRRDSGELVSRFQIPRLFTRCWEQSLE